MLRKCHRPPAKFRGLGARTNVEEFMDAVPTGDEVREALRVLRESTAEARRNAEAMQLREQRARFFLTMFIVSTLSPSYPLHGIDLTNRMWLFYLDLGLTIMH